MLHSVYPVWRKAREWPAVITWFLGAALLFLLTLGEPELALELTIVPGVMVICGILRLIQILALWERKARMVQQPEYVLMAPEIMKKLKHARRRARRGKLQG